MVNEFRLCGLIEVALRIEPLLLGLVNHPFHFLLRFLTRFRRKIHITMIQETAGKFPKSREILGQKNHLVSCNTWSSITQDKAIYASRS